MACGSNWEMLASHLPPIHRFVKLTSDHLALSSTRTSVLGVAWASTSRRRTRKGCHPAIRAPLAEVTDPAFTLTPDPHACSPTLTTPSLTPTLTPTLTPALTPTLVVAAACPKGHYRTGCGGMQLHDDSSDTRTQHVQSHGEPVRLLAWVLWLEAALFRSNTSRQSPTSPVCFNPGATPWAIARSVRWATTRTTS